MKLITPIVDFLNKRRIKIGKRRFNKRFFLIITLFTIATWMIWKHFSKNEVVSFSRDDAKRFHSRNIQSRLESEKGTGCVMPKTNPFAAEIMKYIEETPQVRCYGTDWVECIGSRCSVISRIRDTEPLVECYYSDIIYVNDKKYYIAKPIKVESDENYVLNRSDHVHVHCIGNPMFPFSWWSPTWKGVKTGLRHVEVPSEYHGQEEPINVLMLGLDTVSHNQFLRKLPLSYNILTEDLGAVVLNSYTILGDGTPAALFPILTGKTELEMPDARKVNKDRYFDPRQFLFGQLRLHGYRTAYFEDSPHIETFQLRFNGFSYQLADHYLRHYFMAATTGQYCAGAVPRYALMLNLTQQFIKREGKNFCFTWIVDICHDDPNLVSTIEEDLLDFLTFLKVEGILKNTLVFIMTDHGPRFDGLRFTYQGKIEERLPFMAIILPENLKQAKPNAEKHLRENVDVLTTPFDIRATILDALDLRHLHSNYTVPGSELPRAMSLLKPIPKTRSCAEADVLLHWCACLQWVNVSQIDPIYERVANELVNFINSLVAENFKCAKRRLLSIEWVTQRRPNEEILKYDRVVGNDGYLPIFQKPIKHFDNFYQVQVSVGPGHAVFEGTVTLTPEYKFLVSENDISRIDSYGDEPKCVVDTHPHLSKYCFCNSLLSYWKS